MAIRFQRTAITSGDVQEATALADEVCKYLTETLDVTTVWGAQIGGTFQTLHWFSEYANMAEMEAAMLKIFADAGYNEIVAKAKDLFVEGSTEDSIIYMS